MNIKKLFTAMLLCAITLPMAVSAQKRDDSRYLQGAIPEVNGKVVFSKEFLINGMSKDEVYNRMLKLLQKGSVLVDVAIDQGGCFETSHPTTHSEPAYVIDGIVHYAVANIPGAVAYTSTLALTNATMPYAIALADKGWKEACKGDDALLKGLNVVEGKVTFKAVADLYKKSFVDPKTLL